LKKTFYNDTSLVSSISFDGKHPTTMKGLSVRRKALDVYEFICLTHKERLVFSLNSCKPLSSVRTPKCLGK
jgi:hypothetical protein